MPQPTPQQLHIDVWLTDMAIAWSQDQSNFIADKVFPVVPVNKQSDKYLIYNKGYFYRDEMSIRPLGGRPRQAGYEVSNGSYFCDEWALEDKIDDRVRDNADQPADPDLASMRLLTGQALIHRDIQWANTYFVTGKWGTDWIGNTDAAADGEVDDDVNHFLQFDQSGSDPIGFFDQIRENVGGTTGYEPNVLVLGTTTYRVLKNHPDVVDRIKYTQRGVVTPQILAQLFDVDQVLIPKGVVNAAPEGLADNIGYILAPTGAMMAYAAPAPTIQAPSAGYCFAWTGLVPGVTNAFGGVLERGREELAHSDVIQIRAAYDMQQTASELGVFFADCVSA